MTQTTPFSAAEITDVRRFAGWHAYAAFGYMYQNQLANLDRQLAGMSDQEQAVIRTVYLANLSTLESAVLTSGTNIGTDQAAVWKRNKNETADRQALFNLKRREMCAFIGVAPGPGLGSGASRVVRG